MIDIITSYKGEAHITAADDGSKNTGAFGELVVFEQIGEALAYQIISNNSIRIKAGDLIAQGRHIRVKGYEDVAIETGTQLMNRNDLICIHYVKSATTGVETVEFTVKRGTETSGTPEDPTYITGDINDTDMEVEIPIYRVYISGFTVTTVTPLFTIIKNYQEMQQMINQLATDVADLKANKAPAYTYGTEDLTAGTSSLETGKLHFVYEA